MNVQDPGCIKFSWLVPVGPATLPEQLEQCVMSIIPQMLNGDELILVRDNDPQGYRCQYGWVDRFGPMIKGDRVGARWPLDVDCNPQVVTIDAGPDCRDCGKALNVGLMRAKNPYIIRQDADDWDLPNRRSFHVAQILEDPDAVAWGGAMRRCMWVGYETPGMALNPVLPRMLHAQYPDLQACLQDKQIPIPHPASCFKLRELIDIGGYPEGMRWCEDYGLWIRLWLAGHRKVACAATPIGFHRQRQEPRIDSDWASIKASKEAALARMNVSEDPDPTRPRVKIFNWSQPASPPAAAIDPSMVTINGQSVPCGDALAAYQANPTEPDEKADKKRRQRNRNKSSTETQES